MEEIFSFITNHWVEWLFAGATFVALDVLCGALVTIAKSIYDKRAQ